MAQLIDVPNYGQVEFPDGMSDADIVSAIKKNAMGYKVGAGNTAQESKQGTLANIGLGALKGASDIGRTLLRPFDAMGVTGMNTDERKASLSAFFQDNADPESLAFKGGELGADVAGTAGAGGILAKGLKVIPALAKFAPAIESGGFTLGPAATRSTLANTALRSGAGAVNGAAMSGLVNPGDAKSGAIVGAALPPALQVAGKVGGLISSGAKKALGATTGVGDEAIDAALQAGKSGNKDFLQNMRREVPLTDVLDQAKSALGNMRAQRAAEYRANMDNITTDKTVLDFSPIIDAVKNLKATGTFKGQVINKNAASTVDDIANTVDEWAKLNPGDFHTPEGLDALKKAIGDIRDSTQFGTPARKSADEVYNAIKNQITMQAPTYAKTMKSYAEASELITEIERSLSLGNKAAADTSMRKLQSLMRNNVNTNYGNRLDLAKTLADKGGEDIIPAVAGQSMSSWMPRGLAKLGQYGAGIGAVMGNPALAATIPLTSPRLVGEALYKSGQVLGGANKAASSIAGNPRIASAARGLLDYRYPLATAIPMALTTHELAQQ